MYMLYIKREQCTNTHTHIHIPQCPKLFGREFQQPSFCKQLQTNNDSTLPVSWPESSYRPTHKYRVFALELLVFEGT